MFDTALIDAMNHALAFQPPPLTQEVVDVRSKLAEFRDRSKRKLASADRQLSAWIRAGVAVRAELQETMRRAGIRAIDIGPLNNVIEAVDQRIAADAKTYEHVAKTYVRQRKEAKAISPEVEAAVAEVAAASLQLLAKESLERVEFGTFLRALRAEYDPAAQGGPVFDNADELRRYLEAATH